VSSSDARFRELFLLNVRSGWIRVEWRIWTLGGETDWTALWLIMSCMLCEDQISVGRWRDSFWASRIRSDAVVRTLRQVAILCRWGLVIWKDML
jgi:hypothetical protein